MKILVSLFFISALLYAREVSVTTSGESLLTPSMSPKEKENGKAYALLQAKHKASQEAGTTIYSSISSKYSKGSGEQFNSDIQAISASVLKYKIIKEEIKESLYRVYIDAIVEVADVEAIYEKADKRLVAIRQAQNENRRVLRELASIRAEIARLTQSKYYSKEQIDFEKQEKKILNLQNRENQSFERYTKNIKLHEAKFKKGSLLDIAQERESDVDIAKKDIDTYYIYTLRDGFSAKVKNIEVRKHGDKADVYFDLMYRQNHSFYNRGHHGSKRTLFYNTYVFGTDRLDSKETGYIPGKFESCFVNFNISGAQGREDIIKFIEDNTMAVQVKIGDRLFITDPVFGFQSTIPGGRGLMFSRPKDMYIFNGSNGGKCYSKRVALDIPLSELEDVDTIWAELVFTDRDITKEFKGGALQNYKKNEKLDKKYGNSPLPLIVR